MKKKIQIFIVHGGNTPKNDKEYLDYIKNRKITFTDKVSWHGKYLDEELGKKFQIAHPRMPLPENAKYRDWKIHFEKFFPYFRNNIILIGNSLGSIFLAKYLSENKFPKKILSIYLVCPPYDNSLGKESLAGGFKLGKNLSRLDKCSKKLYVMFSKDDPVIPIGHAEKYRKKLKNAKIIIFKSKNGHFQIEKFPEIVRIIKNDLKTP